MKKKYIELMERALLAYTNEHIERYFSQVKRDGLAEHGFPRLTANIGVLISHGRRLDLHSVFVEMMDFCCRTIPAVKAANDFSVREIISCISSLEQSGTASAEEVARWKGYLRGIDPASCYDKFAVSPTDKVKNWALFTGVSEFFRQKMGLCDSADFIELQIASQLQWLDENGMYMDKLDEVHHPIVYDLVARGLFVLLLDGGYRGKYYKVLDDCLRRAALLSLKMQSPNGEIPFGGRSNQFIHTEAWLMTVYEYEAKRYEREGNYALASAFKAAIARAIAVTEQWLMLDPIYHIKNRFPTNTKHGCEGYAYFDKYMITVASNLYAAYLVCDDSISTPCEPDHAPCAAVTSEHFHKLFLRAGGYGLEYDMNADPHYDASGVGRIHREGAPSAICLSVPCPSSPAYTVDIEPRALSLCPGIREGGEWRFFTDSEGACEIISMTEGDALATAVFKNTSPCGNTLRTGYTVSAEGVDIKVSGEGDVAFLIPAFSFDGERYTEISHTGAILSVKYNGWQCVYTASGEICDLGYSAANRNGHYKAFCATARDLLTLRIKINKLQ